MPEARILVVEDENIVAVDIQDRLEHLGYEVVGHAVSGEEAVRLAAETSPDLVLMDIMLKGDMDGVEAAELIRRDFDIPVVYLTAYADTKTLHRAKTSQPYGYILKPFEEREVHSAVEMAIYRHRVSRQLRESQQWLSAVLRSLAEAVITTDMGGKVTFVNPLAEHMTGTKLEQVKGKPLSDMLHLLDPNTKKPIEALIPKEGSHEELLRGAFLMKSPGGGEGSVSLTSAYITDDREQTTGAVFVFQDIAEQKRAEEEIRLAKERAELIYRVTPSAIFTVDHECTITTWNDRAHEITGYAADEAIGKKCFFFESDICSNGCLLFPVGNMEVPNSGLEGTILTKEKETRFVSRNLDYLRSSSGEIIGGIESFEDITERMMTEAELRESELRFRSVVQTAGDAIILSDSQGRIIFWNSGAESIFGYSTDEILGKSVSGLMPERLRHIHAVGMERLTKGVSSNLADKTIELTGLRKDGTEFPLELSITTWEAKGEMFASSIIRDISERKRAEEELESTLSELNIIFENATVGIIFVMENEMVRVNSRFEEIFGYSRSETVGNTPEMLFKTHEDFLHLRDQSRGVLLNGDVFSRDYRLKRKDGSTFWGQLLGKSIDPSEFSKGTIWILEDISERRKVQEQMKAAKEAAEQASRFKSEFLANMSHEIRTPMNGILGMIELILETKLTTEQAEYISIVKQSANNLLSLLNDVLDFSKVEAGRLELEATPFNLRSALYSTTETFSAQAQRKGLDLLSHISPEVPLRLLGDPGRLRQVIVNLLGNAVKFTDEGSIEVNVRLVGERPGPKEGSREVVLHFMVKDTGKGISEDKLDLIFESFTQADGSTTRVYGGTGLGLAISRQIVQLMGGDIWVESTLGEGSAFHFTATFNTVTEPLDVVMTEEKERDFHGLQSLVVGEFENGPDPLKNMLQSWGFKVHCTSKKDELSGVIRRAVMPFDLVLLDSSLIDQDPFSLIGELRADPRTTHAPIVLLMAAGLRGDAARCRELGIAAYLHKPFTQSDLMDVIVRSLRHEKEGVHAVVTQYSLKERGHAFHVLMAEDNVINQNLAERILKKEGISVKTVRNGKEAIEALKHEQFSAVLMDIQMPVMDGIEATQAIRAGQAGAENAHIPIIALTAHAMGGDRERFLSAGMDAYISKPFKTTELMGALFRCTTNRRPEAKPKETGGSVARETLGKDEEKGMQDVLNVDRALELLDGDTELLYDIWQDFADEADNMLRSIGGSVGSGDHATLERESHSLKSASGSIGAERLRELALRLETAARERSESEYNDLYMKLRNEFDIVVKSIKSKLYENSLGKSGGGV